MRGCFWLVLQVFVLFRGIVLVVVVVVVVLH